MVCVERGGGGMSHSRVLVGDVLKAFSDAASATLLDARWGYTLNPVAAALHCGIKMRVRRARARAVGGEGKDTSEGGGGGGARCHLWQERQCHGMCSSH